jgi:hypothetical protein
MNRWQAENVPSPSGVRNSLECRIQHHSCLKEYNMASNNDLIRLLLCYITEKREQGFNDHCTMWSA